MDKSIQSIQKVALVFGSEPFSLTQKVFQTISSIFNDAILVSNLTSFDEILNKISVVPTVILGIHSKEGINTVDLIDSCKTFWSLKVPIIIITTEEDRDLKSWALSQGVLEVLTPEVAEHKLEDLLYELLFTLDPKSLTGKLLCVEDSLIQQRIIAKYLEDSNIEITFSDTVEDAFEKLKKENFDLILVDFFFPGELTGLDLVKYFRKQIKDYDIPIIVMTSYGDERRKEQCLRSGADGFLTKPFSKEELIFTLKNLLQRYFRIKELTKQVETLKEKTLRDSLTGVYNRSALEVIVSELERSYARDNIIHTISLIILDIDNFKKINDTYGHLFGDFVLKNIGEIISSKIRKTDYCIRYGGEEFLILLVNCDQTQAVAKAEEIRSSIEMANPNNVKVTVSLGLASGCVTSAEELYKLVELADRALYAAKMKGKNRVEVAS